MTNYPDGMNHAALDEGEPYEFANPTAKIIFSTDKDLVDPEKNLIGWMPLYLNEKEDGDWCYIITNDKSVGFDVITFSRLGMKNPESARPKRADVYDDEERDSEALVEGKIFMTTKKKIDEYLKSRRMIDYPVPTNDAQIERQSKQAEILTGLVGRLQQAQNKAVDLALSSTLKQWDLNIQNAEEAIQEASDFLQKIKHGEQI